MNPAFLTLFVAIPLFSAGFLVVVRHAITDRLLLLGVPALIAGGGALLLVEHTHTPVLAHQVGGFLPGVAIPFVSDTLTALMLVVTAGTTFVVGTFLIGTGEDRYRFVPSLVLMLTAGVDGALLTGDLFNLFVWIEVMLLPSYALLALAGTWRRLGVGRMFVLVNLLTSTVLLIGVGYVYAVTGTVTLAALAGVANENPRAALAFLVVLAALSVKAGIAPVHGWLPRSYPATSAGIMALFSALHTKVGLYAIFRVYSVVYDGRPAPWMPVLVILVVATMLLGALATFGESRIRSILAYQMVSGVGHILIGLVVLGALSLSASLFYLVHHIVTMGALLLLAGAIEETYGTGRLDRLQGLVARDPWVAVAFALGLFSLVGLPPTSGLWGKVGLVQAASADGTWVGWTLISAIVLASIISLLALQRLWNGVFWGRPMERYRPDHPTTGRGPLIDITDDVRVSTSLAMPGYTLITISVLMFFGAGPIMPVIQRAADGLVDLQPYIQAVLP
ncbi:monovalent cation/H+ antiporter subunit D family protein [Gephyromycinifex aptenodytis]|uniref:monovalent cation/H+ antiporter subunit D family protein n=1 Tax=Gephyromycinifex aptenodytis TaxID=2716227 RepID=UPI001446408B|nr:monovalent cation/H+ antiporter subunit D family protein [Gephyromycinifex aptenodytis]